MDNRQLRAHFGLTQKMMADWLGVARSSLALAERGHQPDPTAMGVQNLRLALAAQGLVYDGAGGSFAAPVARPEPLPNPDDLRFRLRQCQYTIQGLEQQLETLTNQGTQYAARLAAAPALRAYPGPVASPEDEADWLTIFELEARRQLREHCGATARHLLEARLTGLRCEAGLLAELVEASVIPSTPAP